MDITEKRKLLWHIVTATKTRVAARESDNNAIVNILDLPAIQIKVKEYRPLGKSFDVYVTYLGKEHQIDIRANGFNYDIFERTDNNFWDTFDEVTTKILLS